MPLPLSAMSSNSARVWFAESYTKKETVPVGIAVVVPDNLVTCAVNVMEPPALTLMETGEAVTVVVVVARQPAVGRVVPFAVTLSTVGGPELFFFTAVKR